MTKTRRGIKSGGRSNVVKNMRETLSLFLQGVPNSIDIETLENEIESIDNVKSTHHTHIRSLDGEHHVLRTHAVVDKSAPKERVLCV